jgi:hypothetical protein
MTLVGVHVLTGSHAESEAPYASSEAESGALTAPATIAANGTASGGSAVRFGHTYYWMINDGELSQLIKAGLTSAQLSYFFNNDHTLLIIGSSPALDAQLPHALKVKKYASEALLASAAAAGFPSGINYVAYDGETWSFTPQNEQKCPIDYAAMAEKVVHQNHLGFIYTPATDLAPKLSNSSGCQTNLGTGSQYAIPGALAKYADFLNQNFAGLAAPNTDILEIQAQQLQPNSAGFDYFSSNAVAQANTATNSKVPVLIGLTTDDNNQAMTLQQLVDAYNGTKAYASGYWLNIPATGTPDPALAVSFLQQVYTMQGN